MNRPLVNVIKEIIDQQSNQIGPIANLQGSPIVFEDLPTQQESNSTWRIYNIGTRTLDTIDLLSPDELLNRITGFQIQSSPVLPSVNGVLIFPSIEGTTMASTVIQAPQALGFDIHVLAPGKNIAIYTNETLVRRGVNELSTTTNFPAGNTPLHIVTAGNTATNAIVQIPADIRTSITTFIPPQPQWLNSGSLVSNYVDPKTGSTGIGINWYNQENVGGWGVYELNTTNFGTVTGASSVGGRYILHTNFSGTVPYVGTLTQVGPYYLGPVENSYYDTNENESIVIIKALDGGDKTFDIISGTLQILAFSRLANIAKSSNDSIITFVDTNVKAGTRYYYTLDSYSTSDPTLRSDKIKILNTVAGDIFPPGPISLISVNIDVNKKLTVTYNTPADEDYYATKAVFYYAGSGTGQVINTNYIVDVGFPSNRDSLTMQGLTSGTFFFITADILGNTQYIFSGVPYYWNGSGAASGGVNTAPTISIAQLSAEEMSIDPRLFAQFKLSAFDAETPGSVQVQYKINSGTADPWIIAGTNPFTVTVGVLNRDGWVLARAFDGSLFSNELVGTADFDTTPELSSVYARYIVSSGIMFVTGTVDDDAKSIKWYIDNGAQAGDPTISSPLLIDNLTTNKTFNFSFSISDGQRKIFKIDPYPILGGLGNIGNSYREEVVRLPKTSSSIKDRTLGGAVTKTDVQVTLSSSPALPDGTIFDRIKPVVNGTVTSAGVNSITDSNKSWLTNQYATYYDIEIVGGTGLGQRRNIVSGSTSIQSISPSWLTTPDTTSKYYIAETFRHYSDSGKVVSATANSLTDSTKSWVPNEFIGKELTIYSGVGTGQAIIIDSGTTITQYFSTPLSTVPNSTSGYIINGPLNVTRNTTEDIIVDYYAFVPTNGLTEESRSLSIDDDTTPTIKSGTLIEITPGVVTVALYSPDDDTKYWSLWARRNNWPTISSGSATAALDNDYLRFSSDITTTNVTFAASNGWWYGIILPYDSYANPGDRTIFSGFVDGVGTSSAAILTIQVDKSQSGGQFPVYYNKIWWTHNSVVEKPGGNGNITVKIWAKKSGDPSFSQISTEPRYGWQDSEDNNSLSNTDDTLNSLLSRGSWIQAYSSFESPDTIDYRVDLYDTGVFVQSYFTQGTI